MIFLICLFILGMVGALVCAIGIIWWSMKDIDKDELFKILKDNNEEDDDE